MKTVHPSPLLRFALLVDAVVSGAMGVLQLSAAAKMASLLELPQTLLERTAEFMVIYMLVLAVMATRIRLWSTAVMFIVFGNLLWSLGCVALLLTGTLSPNALGTAFVLMQAAAVTVFAVLEWRGLRRSAPARGAPGAALS
jgi:hypothetical protein